MLPNMVVYDVITRGDHGAINYNTGMGGSQIGVQKGRKRTQAFEGNC